MMSQYKVFAAIVVLLLAAGCRQRPPIAPVSIGQQPGPAESNAAVEGSQSAAKTAETNEPAKAEPSQPKAEESKASGTPTEDAKSAADSASAAKPASDATQLAAATTLTDPKQSSVDKDVAPSTAVDQPADANVEPHERIVLLAPGGPIVIDVMLHFQGQNFDSALAHLADEAFRIADQEGDGKTTWEDLANNPRFRSGEFGNLVADTDEERKQLIRIYDVDNDGFVDREELPRFLTRNAGGGKSFSLRSSNEFRSSNRRRSPTRLLIDADRDGAITAEEMEAAPLKLLNRDTDDDEIVLLAELKDTTNDMMMPQTAMMSNRRRVTEPDTAVWLTDKSVDVNKRWGMVQFQLQELYSFGEPIAATDWPMTPELFRAIDTDSNGSVAKGEIAKLLDVPPHLVLDVSFDSADEEASGPRLKLLQVASELSALKPTVRELPSRISIQLPRIEVELFVNQDATLTNVAQSVKAQFTALDRNQNGYLEKDEVPEQIPGFEFSFEILDDDGDGKVYEQDVVKYVQQRSLVTRAQIRARAADQEDALLTALDTDGDGRLNTREIRLSPTKLKSLDHNGDGQLQSDEIPGSMVVGFVRGNAQQDGQLFSAPATVVQQADQSIPRWFRGMDGNADGKLSPREFFGTTARFQQLDADADGYISVEEAQSLDQG